MLLELKRTVSRDGTHLLPYGAVALPMRNVNDAAAGHDDSGRAAASGFEGHAEAAARLSQRRPQSWFSAARAMFATRASMQLAWFLLLNLIFMALEAVVGLLSNSLTLTTDAAHMLLDCAALVVGLFGEAAARRPVSSAHPFGYARYETLCSLINALLLLLVAASVVVEAMHRMAAPPLINDERLIPVAVGGLCVNLVGLAYFHDHAHGRGGCASECNGCGPEEGGNDNMRAVFLHVLADTMGSVAAIVSSLLARHLEWRWADPCCSLLVAACILAAAIPLLRESATLLMLRTPEQFRGIGSRHSLAMIRSLPHVEDIAYCRVWCHTRARAICNIGILAGPQTDPQVLASRISGIMRRYGVTTTRVDVSCRPVRPAAL